MESPSPTIIDRPKISIDDLDPDSLKILRRLRKFGFRPFYAGGCVRDLLLGHKPNDYDIVSDARPEEVRQIFRNCRVIGRRFRLAHVHFHGKIIEVSTFRAASHLQPKEEDSDLYLKHQNTFGTPEDDALNRDFTVNGLFYDPLDDCIVDFVGGLRDLEKRLVRSIGDPWTRFREDPVRMLRAIKYSARLDLRIEAETEAALLGCRSDLEKCSRARLHDELLKLLRGRLSDIVVQHLLDVGLLAELCPVLSDYLQGAKADDLLWRLLQALSGLDSHYRQSLSPQVLLAPLVFPLLLRDWAEAGALEGRLAHGVLLKAAQKSLSAMAERLALPRKVSLCLLHLSVMQLIVDRQHTHPKKLLKRESFSDALRFLELRYLAGDVPTEDWETWSRWLPAPKDGAHGAPPRAAHSPSRGPLQRDAGDGADQDFDRPPCERRGSPRDKVRDIPWHGSPQDSKPRFNGHIAAPAKTANRPIPHDIPQINLPFAAGDQPPLTGRRGGGASIKGLDGFDEPKKPSKTGMATEIEDFSTPSKAASQGRRQRHERPTLDPEDLYSDLL